MISTTQIDRCIAPLSAYATLKDKRQKARHPKPATLILEEIYQSQKMAPQFVGASATIGRPLRRELARCVWCGPMCGVARIDADVLLTPSCFHAKQVHGRGPKIRRPRRPPCGPGGSEGPLTFH